MQWFRMWVDAIDDEKLRLLAFEDRWHFVAILCLKSSGLLDEPESDLRKQKICIKLGLDSLELETVMKRLETVGLVSSNYQPVRWAKRQFVSDSSTKRVRKFRQRQRNVSVTRSENRLQKQITETEKNPSASTTPTHKGGSRGTSDEDPEWLLDFKLSYPSRAGDQGWRKAVRAAHARVAEGHASAEFIAGAKRYASFCEASGKTGTEFVKQACTFLGPDKPFLLPWHAPPKPETASERIHRALNGSDNSRVIEHEPERLPRAITR